MQIHLARQPIFNRHRTVRAYELLFRDGIGTAFSHQDGTDAKRQVIVNGLILYGIQSLTGGCRAFIKVTRDILIGGDVQLFPPEILVVDIAETMEIADQEVFVACTKLREAGYMLAVDHFIGLDESSPLVSLAEVIKIDIHAVPAVRRMQLVTRLRGRRHKAVLMASHVETEEEFTEAQDEGFSLFQGYFFAHPETLKRKEIPGNKLQYLRLLRELHQPELSLDDVERIIRNDISLSYRLLKYVNSALFGWRSEIKSIRHALALMGERDVRKWSSLVALSHLGEDKPAELMLTGLTRAAFAERIALGLGKKEDVENLFLVGMFSVLDAMIDRPMMEALEAIALAAPIKDALLGKQGFYRTCLDLMLAYERGVWTEVPALARAVGIAESDLPAIYLAAVGWGQRCVQEQSEGGKPQPHELV